MSGQEFYASPSPGYFGEHIAKPATCRAVLQRIGRFSKTNVFDRSMNAEGGQRKSAKPSLSKLFLIVTSQKATLSTGFKNGDGA